MVFFDTYFFFCFCALLFVAVFLYFWRKKSLALKNSERDNNAKMRLIHLYSCWLEMKQQGFSFAQKLKKDGYRTVAIYGFGFAGESLFRELAGSDITVKFIIDQRQDKAFNEATVLFPEEYTGGVDVVIVAVLYDTEHIAAFLKSKAAVPVISIEEVIYKEDDG